MFIKALKIFLDWSIWSELEGRRINSQQKIFFFKNDIREKVDVKILVYFVGLNSMLVYV